MKDFSSQVRDIEKKLGYHFKNQELLQLAFTHRSYWNEHKQHSLGCNERLEFLGDSVLELVIAHYLFLHGPEMSEGELSHIRSQVVDALSCAHYVEKLDVEQYLLLGKGEAVKHSRGRERILADLLESIIGAIFLDADFAAASKFFLSHFADELGERIKEPHHNWKAELQDYVQKKFKEPPTYEVIEQKGPEHAKEFTVAVYVQGKKLASGKGASKKEAETNAAKEAWENL